MSKKRILVTGSGGFVMGNLIRKSFRDKKPYNISSIDRVRDSYITQNIYINQDHNFYIADICDLHTLHVIFQKERPDIVIHGAQEKCSDITKMINSNITGTYNIINECKNIGAKLIYVSDYDVLGMLDETDAPWSEFDIQSPVNNHSITKATAENLIKADKDLDYNIVRFDNCYGPWQSCDKFIPRTIKAILDNKEVIIYNQGKEIRCFSHVYDVSSAIFTIIDNWNSKETYNITSHQEFSALEVSQIICNAIGKGHELIRFGEKEVVGRKAINDSKVRAMGWMPEFKLRDGIKQTAQWYVNNKYVFNL